MSEGKHTPWEVHYCQEWPFPIHVMEGDNLVIAQDRVAYSSKAKTLEEVRDAVGFYPAAGREQVRAMIARQEAVLRLIAAAPELLEAAEGLASDVQCLIDCRADCGEWGVECPLQDAHKPDSTIERLQRLFAAIAKARGAA